MDEKLQIAGKIDQVIHTMMLAISKVKQAAGSNVKLPKAELDLLAQMETARDIIMDVLKNQSDRTLLHDVFGGDCTRIVRIQAICKGVEFSAMNQGDQRLPTCLRACESVEKVLVDLGEGEALRTAQASICDSSDLVGLWLPTVESAEASCHEPHASRRKDLDSASIASSRIMSLVEADAERRESRLRNCLANLEVQFSEHLEGCKESLHQSIANLEARLARRLEMLEVRATDIESQVAGTGQHVSCLSEDLERSAADVKRRCTEIAKRLAETLDHGLADVKKRCMEALEADMKLKTASLEQQLATLTEVDQQRQKEFVQEIDKLKTATNLDPVWQSFAHVGSLVNKLQLRLDDMDKAKERSLWETPRKPAVFRSHSAGATDKSPSVHAGRGRYATDDFADRDFGADRDFEGSGNAARI